MAIPDLNVTEGYASLTVLKQAQLNTAMTSIESHVNTNIKLNLNQIALDVFGGSYSYDNDGAANEVTPLKTAAALLADNETITGAWTFSGATTFNGTVTSSSTFTSSGQMRARAYLSTTAQTVTTATETAIAMNGEDYDVGSMHDSSTNNERLTVPSGGAGVYMISGQAVYEANATGLRELRLYKNGTQVAIQKEFAPDAAQETVLQVVYQDQAAVNDYYELRVYHTRGADLDIAFGATASYLSAMKVW